MKLGFPDSNIRLEKELKVFSAHYVVSRKYLKPRPGNDAYAFLEQFMFYFWKCHHQDLSFCLHASLRRLSLDHVWSLSTQVQEWIKLRSLRSKSYRKKDGFHGRQPDFPQDIFI
ncbi:hypothetical protein NE237_017690 [Protea cynaroides]|uniref:Uncharacterized protein n=1 Tax=Protea cynaroides TaxID=273540 RepID=A0A9Q0K8J6_9MAGN|nr:hypothetical protein NE237_017690 [Protea cynaroides]